MTDDGWATTAPYLTLPPWDVVYAQVQRWLAAGVFEAMVRDLRELPRMAQGRHPDPTAAVPDSRTLQSSAESSLRAGHGRAERPQAQRHAAVDTPGHVLALRVTPANAGDHEQVGQLAEDVPGRRRATRSRWR